MKLFGLLSLLALILASVSSAEVMKQHLWKHRVIVIFSEKDLSKEWKDAREELAERHLIYYQIQKDNKLITNHKTLLTAEQIQEVRAKYDKLTDKSQVILIGKDGGVKKRDDELELKSLYALIDTMPMRQQEIREKK